MWHRGFAILKSWLLNVAMVTVAVAAAFALVWILNIWVHHLLLYLDAL
jgi:hypothetical protein